MLLLGPLNVLKAHCTISPKCQSREEREKERLLPLALIGTFSTPYFVLQRCGAKWEENVFHLLPDWTLLDLRRGSAVFWVRPGFDPLCLAK